MVRSGVLRDPIIQLRNHEVDVVLSNQADIPTGPITSLVGQASGMCHGSEIPEYCICNRARDLTD